MTPVITALLKPHITRLNGSMGSGTDLGRTTVSAAINLVEPADGSSPWANGERHNDRISRSSPRILRAGAVFKSSAFLSVTQTIFGFNVQRKLLLVSWQTIWFQMEATNFRGRLAMVKPNFNRHAHVFNPLDSDFGRVRIQRRRLGRD